VEISARPCDDADYDALETAFVRTCPKLRKWCTRIDNVHSIIADQWPALRSLWLTNGRRKWSGEQCTVIREFAARHPNVAIKCHVIGCAVAEPNTIMPNVVRLHLHKITVRDCSQFPKMFPDLRAVSLDWPSQSELDVTLALLQGTTPSATTTPVTLVGNLLRVRCRRTMPNAVDESWPLLIRSVMSGGWFKLRVDYESAPPTHRKNAQTLGCRCENAGVMEIKHVGSPPIFI